MMLPQLFLLVWAAILGAIIGSFLNVCIYRLPWEKSLFWPGSHCMKCLRPVRGYDNIPVLSWFVLRGRCRDCGEPISPRYMLIEALTGALFGLVFWIETPWSFPEALRYGYHAVFIACLIVATFIDFDLQIIPDSVTVPGMVLGLLGSWFIPQAPLLLVSEPAPEPTSLVGGGLAWHAVLLALGWFAWLAGVLLHYRREEARWLGAETFLLGGALAYLAAQTAVLAMCGSRRRTGRAGRPGSICTLGGGVWLRASWGCLPAPG